MANQEGARRGIFRTTPTRERTPTPVLPEVAPSSTPSRQPEKDPKTKKPLIQRLVNNLALRIVLAGTALAGTGYAAYEIFPPIQRIVDQQVLERFGLKETPVPPTFDNNAVEQIVKAGPNGNAQRATPEQIQKFLQETPPVLEKPKVGEHASKIKMLFPVDLENAKNVKIINSIVDTKGGNSSSTNYYYFQEPNLYLSEGDLFNLPLIKGARTVDVKVSTNKYRMVDIVFSYHLNDGQTVKTRLALWGNNLPISTDILTNIPKYSPSGNSVLDDVTPTQKFDLTENSSIPLFRASGPTRITLILQNDQFGLGGSFETDNNGKLLHQ